MDTNYTGLCIGLREGKEVFYRTAADVIERLGAELDKHRWIPVDERLPEAGKQIIVLWKHARLRLRPSILKVQDTWPDPDQYTHWRPITLP